MPVLFLADVYSLYSLYSTCFNPSLAIESSFFSDSHGRTITIRVNQAKYKVASWQGPCPQSSFTAHRYKRPYKRMERRRETRLLAKDASHKLNIVDLPVATAHR